MAILVYAGMPKYAISQLPQLLDDVVRHYHFVVDTTSELTASPISDCAKALGSTAWDKSGPKAWIWDGTSWVKP